MRLENKVAVVTGAARGIGEAIALALAREGADVVINDVDIELAAPTVDKIKALGRKSMAVKADVAKNAEVEAMFKTILEKFGKVDILVNNAGGSARERQSQFKDSTEEVWDFVVNRNLKGPRNCTRAIINHMIERRSGKIVNLGSTAGILGQAGLVDHSASKAGVIGFTKALAKEVARYGINVNCVSPGATGTRAMLTMQGEEAELLKKKTGFDRFGKPEEIAAMVLFLVSDDVSIITGQNYPVCGLTNLGGPIL